MVVTPLREAEPRGTFVRDNELQHRLPSYLSPPTPPVALEPTACPCGDGLTYHSSVFLRKEEGRSNMETAVVGVMVASHWRMTLRPPPQETAGRLISGCVHGAADEAPPAVNSCAVKLLNCFPT